MSLSTRPSTRSSPVSKWWKLLAILPLFAALIVPAGMTTAAGETATKVDTLVNDVDGDGVADPGDTIRYAVTITNGSGVEMTNVTYTDTVDPNTTLVPGSLEVSVLALDDTFAVSAGGTLNVSAAGVLANDIGAPAPTVTQVNGSGANVNSSISVGGGTLTLNADGSLIYDAPGTSGPVTFTYTATNTVGSDTATVTINVQDAPVAVDDSPAGASAPDDPYHIAIDTLLDSSTTPSYSVLGNDTGGPGLNVVSFGPTLGTETAAGSPGASAQGGTVTVNVNGEFTYDPPSGYIGYDTFVYTMQNGLASDTATVMIAVGVRPTANDDNYDVIGTGSLNVTIPGVLSDDTGSPTLTVTQVNGSGANLGNPISVGGGTLTLNADGSFIYDAPAVIGPVTFTYQASNELSGSTATVTINVVPGPTANDDGPAVGSNPGAPYHTAVNTSITGPTVYSVFDNDTGLAPLSVTGYGVLGNEVVPGNPTPTGQAGSVTLNAAGNIVSYTPPSATFVGADTFKYTMTSSVGGSSTATVTIKVGIPPTANPDPYNVYGNIGISITAPGPLGNDTGDQIVLQSYGSGTLPGNNFTTANGGTFNMAANGAFVYNPPVGYTGTDTVTYVIGNGLGTSSATITFTISSMIWFIDNSAVAGNGRWGSPFNSLAAFNAVNDGVGTHPKSGDRIYVFTGSGPYTGGIVLTDNQQLIGAGSDLAAILGALPTGSPTMPGAGTKPNIRNASGIGVNVGSGNTIRGLDVGASGNTTQIGIARSPAGTVGNLTVLDNVSVTANGGAAVDIGSGSTLNATFAGLSSTNSSAQGLRVTGSGGTFAVTGATSVTNSTSAGVSLTGNGAAITFAALNITNTATNSVGLSASSNTGSITSTSGTINTGSGQAVSISGGAGTTPLNMTLTTVTSSGGSSPGISIQKNSGSFTIVGTGSPNSGGTVSNKTGDTDGVTLINATNVSLNWMTISGNTRHGVFGQTLNGFVLADSTVQNNGNDTINDDSGLYFTNLSGTAPAGSNPTQILDSTVSANYEFNVFLRNDSVTLTELHVENSAISNTPSGGSCPPNCGADGLFAEATSLGGLDGTVGVNIVNSTINNNASDGVQANCLNNGSIDLTVTGSQVSGNNLPINMTTSGTCDLTFDILNNAGGSDGLLNFASFGINLSTANSSTASGTISNNTITGNPATNAGYGIRVNGDHTSSITAMIDGNVVSNTALSGIAVYGTIPGPGISPVFNVNILNNSVSAPLLPISLGDYGIFVESRGTANMCVDVFGNTSIGSGSGPQGVRFRQRDTSTMRLERLSATTSTPGDVATYLTANNTLPTGASVTIALGGSVIAVADGTCAQPIQAAGAPQVTSSSVAKVTPEQVSSLRQAALDYWRNAGASPVQLARMERATFVVTDLPEGTLASTDLAQIFVDANAAGHGWFVDPMPYASSESGISAAQNQMDLFTALMHEMGHVAGIRHGEGHASLMAGDLLAGVRRFPLATPTPTQRVSYLPPLSGETINLPIGDIPAGESVTITFDVTIDATIPATTTQVSNQGTVSWDGGSIVTDDPATGTADDPTVTQVPQADLSIVKSDSPDPVETGTGQVTYTLAVTNNGPSAAQDVVVSDTLPAELTLVSTTGCAEDPTGIPTCTIGTIAGGSTVNITVVADVSTSTPQLSNTATVSSTTHDPDGGDLSDTELTGTVPAAPSGLMITSVTNTQIDLSWTDNSIDETSFRIERSLDGSSWVEIDSVGAGITTYSDTIVTCSNEYHYRVRARRSSADSTYSNVDNAQTDPCAPTSLVQTGSTASSIDMSWTDTLDDETSFRVERSSTGVPVSFAEIDTTAANDNTYTDSTGLACGETWYYRVRAERSGIFSGYSNVLTAHTLSCSLFTNGSFENNTNGDFMPDDWIGKKLNLGALTDRQDCTEATEGSCSMRFVGNRKTKTISQTLVMNGPAGQHFLLSFDSMQLGAPKKGNYRVQVIVYHSKSGKKMYTINLPYSAVGWKHWTLPITTLKSYKKIEIRITYAKKTGTVWFDNLVFAPN